MKSHPGLNNFIVLLCLAVLGTGWSTPVFADCELAKLLASDGAAYDNFGCSVCISGNTAVIGAHGDGDYTGSAYIFRFNGSSWVQEAKLLASDGAAGDNFGCVVGISGDIAIIGARGDDDNTGSAYIFWFNGSSWVQEAKLLASDGESGDDFGISVGIWGDTAIIGAAMDYNQIPDAYTGSAYIFRFNGWSWVQQAKLLASDAGMDLDFFGWSVGICANTAVIGAYGNDDDGNSSGSAYIFRFNGSSWGQQAKLLASDGTADDYFGYCVGISGDTVVIGANGDDDKGNGSGSAYIFWFNDSSWVEEAKLLASDGSVGDNFGYRVGISGDTAIIGANGDDDNGNGSGSAYIFRLNDPNWVEEDKLLASDGAAGDYFGSVGVWGDTAVIGAFRDDNNDSDSGSAYIFGLNLNPGDLDFDNDVDFDDFSIFAEYWLETDCGPCRCDRADCNGDGQVNYYDLKELRDNWLVGK